LQSALDFIEAGYNVHVIADGVSSCNKEEIPFALGRIRQSGGYITTSESTAFQLQRTLSFQIIGGLLIFFQGMLVFLGSNHFQTS
jgi:hypothetical protein